MARRYFDNGSGVSATIVLTDLLTVTHLDAGGRANVEIENTDDADALDQFTVYVKDHADGEWYKLLDTGDYAGNFADFDGDGKKPWLLFVVADAGGTIPNNLAAAKTCHMSFDVGSAYAFKLAAACAGAGVEAAVVKIKGCVLPHA